MQTHCLDYRPPHTTDEEESHAVKEEPSIWRGEFTMHGMARFSATAYAVSGPVEFLEEVCTNQTVVLPHVVVM